MSLEGIEPSVDDEENRAEDGTAVRDRDTNQARM